MARDWLAAFRPASFRGVGFHVDAEESTGARRLSISPIAYAETSVIEDMGRDPQHFPIAAYCAGDAADARALALTAALEARGPGMLVLPMRGPIRARVTGWTSVRLKDRAGIVRFDIDFIEEGLASVPFLPGFAASTIAAMARAGIDLLGRGLASEFASLDAPERERNTIAAGASALRFSAVAGVLDAVGQRDVARAEADLAAASGPGAIDADAFAPAIVSAWRLIGLRASAEDCADTIVAELPVSAPTAVARAERMAMLAGLSIAVVRVDYRSRRDAMVARERLSALSGPVIDDAGADGMAELHAWLRGVTGEAALALSRIAADRAPIVRVEAGVSLPSTVLAHALYGEAQRAGEIVERNAVATPVFMPVAFEALGN